MSKQTVEAKSSTNPRTRPPSTLVSAELMPTGNAKAADPLNTVSACQALEADVPANIRRMTIRDLVARDEDTKDGTDGEDDSTDTEDEDEDFIPDSEEDSTDESFIADSYDDELIGETSWFSVLAELPEQCAMHGILPPGAKDWISSAKMLTKLAALIWRRAQEQPTDLEFRCCSLACLPSRPSLAAF